jgi:ABC-type nitrate/sulfonate/bicarbonate transport system ATPase subunit
VNHNTRLLLLDRPFENIQPATKQSLIQWISDILNTYPTLSTIVTSRNNLEDPQRLQPIGFQALSMDNLKGGR